MINDNTATLKPISNFEDDRQRFTFPKSERLRHRSLVEKLFSEGESIYEFPLRLNFRCLTDKELENNFKDHVPDLIAPLQMMVTVPKKKRRHAVDRVKMRRHIRESYRLARRPLRNWVEEETPWRTVSLGLVYIHNENLTHEKIERKVNSLLSKLQLRLQQLKDNHQVNKEIADN